LTRNAEIRNAIKKEHVTQWRVAMALGVSEQTLIRWLRTELPEEKKAAMLAAIDKLSKEIE